MRVFNDHVMVEIKKPEWVTADEEDFSGNKEDPRAGIGIVVAAPALEDIMFFSNYSWILEQSVFNTAVISKMHDKMSELVGKKVYFEKRSELGNTIDQGGKTYATIKLSKIIFVEE